MSGLTEANVTQRFLTDVLFHARVAAAVAMTEYTMEKATGMKPTPDFRASFIQACAYGLFMADIPLDRLTMTHEQAEESMRQMAEQLGFMLGKQEIPEAFGG